MPRASLPASCATRACLFAIDVVAALELADGDVAHVAVMHAAEQIPQDAFAHGALGNRHGLDAQFLEQGQHDRQAAGQHRFAVRFQAGQSRLATSPALISRSRSQRRPASVMAPSECRWRQISPRARPCRRTRRPPARRVAWNWPLATCRISMRAAVSALAKRPCPPARREKLLGIHHAAHAQAFALARLVADADDAFGGAAADIDHQTRCLGQWQAVGDAQIDQAGFFPAGDDFDVETQRFARLLQERRGVLGHAQGRGAHRAHGARRHAAQAFAEAAQTVQGAALAGAASSFCSRSGRWPGAPASLIESR
jgi:hypothetical protein